MPFTRPQMIELTDKIRAAGHQTADGSMCFYSNYFFQHVGEYHRTGENWSQQQLTQFFSEGLLQYYIGDISGVNLNPEVYSEDFGRGLWVDLEGKNRDSWNLPLERQGSEVVKLCLSLFQKIKEIPLLLKKGADFQLLKRHEELINQKMTGFAFVLREGELAEILQILKREDLMALTGRFKDKIIDQKEYDLLMASLPQQNNAELDELLSAMLRSHFEPQSIINEHTEGLEPLLLKYNDELDKLQFEIYNWVNHSFFEIVSFMKDFKFDRGALESYEDQLRNAISRFKLNPEVFPDRSCLVQYRSIENKASAAADAIEEDSASAAAQSYVRAELPQAANIDWHSTVKSMENQGLFSLKKEQGASQSSPALEDDSPTPP
jgi:hypothetical protein